MEVTIGKSSDYVKLNVGGHLFQTTVTTLTKRGDTMLAAMFSGRMEIQTDSDGWIMIDRCGKHFGIILNFLRDGSVPLPNSAQDIAELCKEAEYYCIKDLQEMCSRKADSNNANNTLKSFVVLSIDLDPTIRNSDSEYLKNILLFEKLSLKYGKLLPFTKRMVSNPEDMKWLFYEKGKQKGEVRYTMIGVVGFEYPEAHIYEELLNLIANVK